MFCINCGKELPEGAKFCMMCGAKVPNIINGVEKDEKIIKRNAIEYAILSTIRDVTQYDEKYYHAVFDENDKQKICEMALTNSPIIYIDYSPDEPKLVSINSEIYEKNKSLYGSIISSNSSIWSNSSSLCSIDRCKNCSGSNRHG